MGVIWVGGIRRNYKYCVDKIKEHFWHSINNNPFHSSFKVDAKIQLNSIKKEQNQEEAEIVIKCSALFGDCELCILDISLYAWVIHEFSGHGDGMNIK